MKYGKTRRGHRCIVIGATMLGLAGGAFVFTEMQSLTGRLVFLRWKIPHFHPWKSLGICHVDADLKSIGNLHQILSFLVPGLVVIFVRAQFVTGWRPSHSTTILSYFAISVIYYAFALPFVDFVFPVREPGDGKILAWLTLIFFGPAALGLILGINTQKNLVIRVLQRLHLNPVHPVPTAWDWKFGRLVSTHF